MDDKDKIAQLLARIGNPDASPLTPEEYTWLEDFRKRYPFFPLTAEEANGLCTPQSQARIDQADGADRFDNFYPQEESHSTPTTLAAIDDFLNTYGHQSEEEDALLERLIFNPIPDYAQQLAAQADASLPDLPPSDANSQDARIDRFILSQKGAEKPTPLAPEQSAVTPEQPSATPEQKGSWPKRNEGPGVPEKPAAPEKNPAKEKKTAQPGLLSESLAKIYIKTHRYERAYEILNDLSLRFPEKSRYFADQLRFLRILIQNEQRLRANQ